MKRVEGENIITIRKVTKDFPVADGVVKVLRGISCDIKKGEFTIIVGPSGCGKSTLLHILLGLEEPTSGSVSVIGMDIFGKTPGALHNEDERSRFRKKNIGMIYQQPQWIKALTVVENVALPLGLNGVNKTEAKFFAHRMLKRVGMDAWVSYFPTQLSSGQQQKIALARALVTSPSIIIADEPTGNLDFESGKELMKLLKDLSLKGRTVIMVTHDLEYLKNADRVIKMFDGFIKEDSRSDGNKK